MKFIVSFFLIFGLLLFSVEGFCASDDFEAWLKGVKLEALQQGISADTIEQAFRRVKPNELVLKLDRNQPEFKLSFQAYLDRVISETRVRKGQTKLKENQQLLGRIASKYGVQERFLVALWGVETDFGRVLGSFPVIEALATLSHDPRRSDFFRAELFHALHVLDSSLATVKTLKGSWAGAFGGLQFLPSVYRTYAQDFNENGRVDIWQEPDDLFATGAQYLAKSGWKYDQTWGREVILPPAFNKELLGLKTRKKISEWQTLGVRRLNGSDLPARELISSLVMPDEDDSRAYLVYSNFQTLLKWNRSIYYALGVGLLSDRLK